MPAKKQPSRGPATLRCYYRISQCEEAVTTVTHNPKLPSFDVDILDEAKNASLSLIVRVVDL